MKKMIGKLREDLSIWKVINVTNLEKLKNGTEEEIKKNYVYLLHIEVEIILIMNIK